MNRAIERSVNDRPALNWRVLGLLNLYRVLAPLVLLALYPLGGARGFTVDSRQLFFGATIAYLCFGIGNVVLVRRGSRVCMYRPCFRRRSISLS